jgi:hypothetical protein
VLRSAIHFGNIGERTVEQAGCRTESEVLGAVFANLTRLVRTLGKSDPQQLI